MVVIFYDLEDIAPEDRERALAAAGPAPVEVAPQGAVLSTSSDSVERLDSAKSPERLDALMRWVSLLIERCQESGGWTRHGASLAEVSRYRFLFDASADLHRWWVLASLVERWKATRVIWVARPRGRADRRLLRILARASAEAGLPCRLLSRFPSMSWWKDLRGRAVQRLWPLAERVRYAVLSLFSSRVKPRQAKARLVLFTDYFPNSTACSVPVRQEVAQRPGVETLWLAGRESVSEALRRLDEPSFLPFQVASPACFLRARLTLRDRNRLREVTSALPVEGLAGPDAGRAAGRYLRRVVRRHLEIALSEAAFWVEVFAECLPRLGPKAVVTTSFSSALGRASALVARAAGARAVFVQHGLFQGSFLSTFFCHDLMLVWGQRERRCLLDAGYPPEASRVTGATLYDPFVARVRAQGKPCLPPAGRPLRVAFLASRTAGAVIGLGVARRSLRAVAEAVRSLPEARLAVKTHPADSHPMPSEILAEYPDFELWRGGSSQDLILESDLVIVQSSTTGFEACLAGRPLIVFNLTGFDGFVEYVRFGAAVEVSAPEDLAPAMRRIQDDPRLQHSLAEGRSRLVDELLDGGSGTAAARAAEALGQALEGSAA